MSVVFWGYTVEVHRWTVDTSSSWPLASMNFALWAARDILRVKNLSAQEHTTVSQRPIISIPALASAD